MFTSVIESSNLYCPKNRPLLQFTVYLYDIHMAVDTPARSRWHLAARSRDVSTGNHCNGGERVNWHCCDGEGINWCGCRSRLCG